MNDRKFRGNYGVSETTFYTIFNLLHNENQKIEEQHLCWALFFLRNYPTQDVAEYIWNKNHETLKYWIWLVIDTFNQISERYKLININERTYYDDTLISMAVDGTECLINRPSDDQIQRIYYSGKKKTSYDKILYLCRHKLW